ncbi:bis(5'-nucleosyl)-tetraphosphatase (symmetrical) YqeK [Thermosipho ferrireducens]|uniref:Bis(5'-nucleosyl)-tetraphosphatase (Symmetrical) YqeK n=2 Tax=Thermosipho ferrireducens TaxID=2571116 RepID=A0ABX7SAA4_9BACT|nr:bis(5'-nucleosyl)-tetraphosphatase (symmetrical) YqeK [Thermosipho ferrireducens]
MVSKKRMPHVIGTVKFATTLARIHGFNENVAEFMGYAHDLFREVDWSKLLKIAKIYGIKTNIQDKVRPVLLHGKIAALFIKKRFKIEEEDILSGISYHTSGYKDFGTYGKILFLADSLEETRIYPKIDELRLLAYKDLDMAFYEVLRNKISYAVSRDLLVLPETVEAWNESVIKRNM